MTYMKVDMLEGYSMDDLRLIYNEMYKEWEKHLKNQGVKKPGIFGTVGSLQLLFLYSNKGRVLHKSHLQMFVNRYIPSAGDQQPRHLGPQHGYNVIRNNDRINENKNLDDIGIILYQGCNTMKNVQMTRGGRSGWIMLVDFKNVHAGWKISQTKRNPAISGNNWEEKKAIYDYRCATCGAKEGEVSYIDGKTVTLDKGHMDPTKELSYDNTIPQCITCNGQYRDKAVFDYNGRVIACATTELIDKSSSLVKEQFVRKWLEENRPDLAKKL